MGKVLIFDSGLGGATILKNLIRNLSAYDFVYFVQNRFAPLGSKSKKRLLSIAIDMIEHIQKRYTIDMLILACNTLTISCIEELRARYDFCIVGTEPNVKFAQNDKTTLALATPYTIENCAILRERNFQKISMPKLSKMIDKHFPYLDKCKNYIKSRLGKFAGVKSVILGCTHYVLVSEQICKILGNVSLFDAIDGVTGRVMALYDFKQIRGKNIEILLAKKDERFLQRIKSYLFEI